MTSSCWDEWQISTINQIKENRDSGCRWLWKFWMCKSRLSIGIFLWCLHARELTLSRPSGRMSIAELMRGIKSKISPLVDPRGSVVLLWILNPRLHFPCHSIISALYTLPSYTGLCIVLDMFSAPLSALLVRPVKFYYVANRTVGTEQSRKIDTPNEATLQPAGVVKYSTGSVGAW